MSEWKIGKPFVPRCVSWWGYGEVVDLFDDGHKVANAVSPTFAEQVIRDHNAMPKMREAMMGLMGWGEVEEDDGETVRISGPHAEWFKVFAAAQAALEEADDR